MLSLRGISNSVASLAPRVVVESVSTRTVSRPTALVPVSTPQHPRHRGSASPWSRMHSTWQQHQPHRRPFQARAMPMPPAAASITLEQQQPPRRTTTIAKRWHGGPHVDHEHAESVHVSFVDGEGNLLKQDVDAYVGESLLQVAQRNEIDLEGACEGVCACSTCHVIFPDWEVFDALEEASEDEEDMLDMAYGLTETSRLGCQIRVDPGMDGMLIEIPAATRNFYVDGHVPKPH